MPLPPGSASPTITSWLFDQPSVSTSLDHFPLSFVTSIFLLSLLFIRGTPSCPFIHSPASAHKIYICLPFFPHWILDVCEQFCFNQTFLLPPEDLSISSWLVGSATTYIGFQLPNIHPHLNVPSSVSNSCCYPSSILEASHISHKISLWFPIPMLLFILCP